MNLFQKLSLVALFLFVSLVICYPSMTRYGLYNDHGPSDEQNYINMYKGHDLKTIIPPFRYRILVPLLARLIPSPPSSLTKFYYITDDKIIQFKFGIVNMLGLTLAVSVLFAYLISLRFLPWQALIGVFLYFTSYEISVNSGSPMTDTWAFAMLILCFYLIRLQKFWELGLAFLIGLFFKEIIFFSIFAIFAFSKDLKTISKQTLFLVPGVIAYLIFKQSYAGLQNEDVYSISFIINSIKGWFDISHILYLSIQFMFAFGPLWILAFLGWKQRNSLSQFPANRLLPFGLFILFIPLLLSTNPSRIWFIAFPFVLPLALLGLLSILKINKV